MLTVEKNTQVNFKTNDKWLAEAKRIFEHCGLDVTSAFNEFIHEVIVSRELPFKTEKEKEREGLIQKLGMQIDKNLEAIKHSEGVSVKEARKRLGI